VIVLEHYGSLVCGDPQFHPNHSQAATTDVPVHRQTQLLGFAEETPSSQEYGYGSVLEVEHRYLSNIRDLLQATVK
jgi:hypothetical protein